MMRGDLTPEHRAQIVSGMLIRCVMQPVEISYAVAWLASRDADVVTGQNVSPNGGQAVVGIVGSAAKRIAR